MFSLSRIGVLISCVLTMLLGLAWAQPAQASQGNELWTMQGVAEGQAFTIAKIDLTGATPVTTVYGAGIWDPNVHDVGDDWTTIAVSQTRNLYLLRRLAKVDGTPALLHVYTVPADSIHLHVNSGAGDPIPSNVIDNLIDVGTLQIYNNCDGLCFGPDGNIYFTAASAIPIGAGTANGLYRFRISTGTTEFVGTFNNQHFVGNPSAGTIDAGSSRTVFYTDAAFDPNTGFLVGDGIDPNGRFTLYQLDGNTVLTAGSDAAHPPVLFDWHYFGGDSSAWASLNLAAIGWPNPDGVAFDAASGNLYLSADGQGVGMFDRDTASNLGYLDNSVGFHLGYDLASIVGVPPSGTPGGGTATRTWGFYKTHLTLFSAAVASGAINLGDLIVLNPQQSTTVTHEDLMNTVGELSILEAIFYTAPGASTTPLGQARLQLAHQLIAAEVNAYYLGTVTPDIVTLINDARTALDGTDIALMNTLTGQLDTFNNSGDAVPLTSPFTEGKADPKGAAAVAASGPGTGPAFN